MDRSAGGIIPEIVQEHFDVYRFLWRQWQSGLRSPDFTLRDLARLEERMEAHLDGLLVAGEHALPQIEGGLSAEEPAAVLAAAYALLAMDRDDTAAKVVEAFSLAEGPALEGLRDALCLGDATRALTRLSEMLASPSATLAVATAEVLAFHGRFDANSGRLARLLTHEDPAVRAAAWRVVAILDCRGGQRR